MDFEADVEEETQREKGSSMEEKRNETIHVLAVDDNMLERKLLEKLLRVSSYQVTCVDSVDKALEYLGLLDKLDSNSAAAPASSRQQGLKVHLIMTDYCMPGMSGYDLLQRVKKSSWKDIPVVVMSSENVPSRIDMCLEGGAEEFLLKPVQLSDLQKLQPHLLKSINHQSCTDNNNNRTQNELLMVATEEENHNEEDNINDEISNNYITNNNSSSSLISKRKAISPEAPDRRAKLEGLAVL